MLERPNRFEKGSSAFSTSSHRPVAGDVDFEGNSDDEFVVDAEKRDSIVDYNSRYEDDKVNESLV